MTTMWAYDERNVLKILKEDERAAYRQIEDIDQCPANLRCHPWHGVDNDFATDDKYDVD